MRSTCLIFDLDGVLIDTADAHEDAWNATALEFRIATACGRSHLTKGLAREQAFECLFGELGLPVETKHRIMERKTQRYLEEVTARGSDILLKGVDALLSDLHAASTPLAVYSASRSALRLLMQAGISQYFSLVSDGNSPGRGKPNPDRLQTLVQRLGFAPRHCVLFEDSLAGLQSGYAAGTALVAIGSINTDLPLLGRLTSLAGIDAIDLLSSLERWQTSGSMLPA